MSNSTTIKNKLRSVGLAPRKSLGQNFLSDDDVARKIVRFAGIKPTDIAVEIGPGIGALTRHLAQFARHVIAIEIDRNLIPLLEQELSDVTNVTILQADALEVDYARVIREAGGDETTPVRVVGNLPYYITSMMIRRILESHINTQAVVLTVQLEVAERMTALPGDMSLLAVGVQVYGKPELLMKLDPSVFYPQPEIDSAVVRIIPQGRIEHTVELFDLARAGFSQKRKQMRNTISAGLRIAKPDVDELLNGANIDPTRRAETLSIPEWAHLADNYVSHGYSIARTKRSDNLESDSDNNSDVAEPNTANSTEA